MISIHKSILSVSQMWLSCFFPLPLCDKYGKHTASSLTQLTMKQLIPLLCSTLLLIAPVSTAAGASSDQHGDVHAASAENPRYWITTSSGKTHNRSCRYYKKSKGHGSDTPSGNDCKICGGASRG